MLGARKAESQVGEDLGGGGVIWKKKAIDENDLFGGHQGLCSGSEQASQPRY
jgi:hypothetical protein